MSTLFVALITACSSSPESLMKNNDDGGSGGDMATSMPTGGGDMASSMPTSLPSSFGSYIELGDSISDNGGMGPFFYNLLFQNDDTMYPQWAGLDLKTKFNVQMHVHGAVAGSQSKDVQGQVAALPATLPGPVLVTITTGGNDLRAAAPQAISGMDQQYLDQMRSSIDGYLTDLTKPGRFGAGVTVYVLQANIYDPTDKTGNFSNCPLPLSLYMSNMADAIFGRWNQVISDELPKFPESVVEPLHDDFLGHGIHDTDNWFFGDCIHPNTKGHHQLRRLIWKALTGADGPA
jgi:lysophospholipase L1-like esterase